MSEITDAMLADRLLQLRTLINPLTRQGEDRIWRPAEKACAIIDELEALAMHEASPAEPVEASVREKVARAIYESSPTMAQDYPWSEVHEDIREGQRRAADAAIAALQPDGEVAPLREAVAFAGRMFRDYEAQHRAKQTDEADVKANRNARFAERMDAALRSPLVDDGGL